jgi:ABC-2 type transport system permease protein
LSACLTLIYIESDSVIWLYRYVLTFGRFPPEVFPPFLQGFFTFILPVFVVIAFPVKSLIGILGPTGLVLAPTISLAIFILSIYFWRSAIWRYQSDSS